MFTLLSQGDGVLIILLRSLVAQICPSSTTHGAVCWDRFSLFCKAAQSHRPRVGGLQHPGLCTECAYVHPGSAHPTTPIFVPAPIFVITDNLRVFKSFILALALKQKRIGNFLTTSIVILATKCLSRLFFSKITLT